MEKKEMRILVCGGRTFGYKFVDGCKVRDIELTNSAIDAVKGFEPTLIIQGNANGGDEIGVFTAEALCIPCLNFPADWDKYGKAAGYIRNKQMRDEGKPDLVVAFPGGKGTANMVKLADGAGIKVEKIGW